MDIFLKIVGAVTFAVLGVMVAVIGAPLIYAASGYLAGWVLARVFPFAGDWVVTGAAAMNIEVARMQLPVVGAFLGFVGAFFKATQTNKVKKK